MRSPTLLLLLALTCLIFPSCKPENPATATRPNIIWLVAEDISPALGCYGDAFATTPRIDALAAQSLVYTRAYATAPICAPARSCLISGRYATSLGTQHLRCEIPFPPSLKTLPEHLQAAGYFTTNRNKTDYNFDPQSLWDHWSGSLAPWRTRSDAQPFFSFINVGPSHEGSVNNEESYRNAVANLPTPQLHDPGQVPLPPYYPDDPETREVWAHYYDVMTVMDQQVGQILDSLEADGLMEETIIFFFGDHGFGMPRYKRWLYQTGLRVPLVVHIPPKYRHLAPATPGTQLDGLVSFIDFAPTVLQLAGAEAPATMPGQAFLGEGKSATRPLVFGARDRADDMYETSRAVLDGRYIYIRHYLPHLPPIQPGFIYADGKHAFRALRRLHREGKTNAEQEKLWQPKPLEELYDLLEDPQELNNLAAGPAFSEIKQALRQNLHDWMIETQDLGLLPEAEYMIRSADSTPYDYARSGQFQVENLLAAAEGVGMATAQDQISALDDPDSGVRYWAVMGLAQHPPEDDAVKMALKRALADPSPSVQLLAAETICRSQPDAAAVAVLGKWVQDERPWLALQAARSTLLVGERARPLIPILYQVLEKNIRDPEAKQASQRYLDFNFSAFTSWAIEWTLQELGEPVKVNGG